MKNIQPLNPEALQKTMEALGGTAPTTPPVTDTSKIYSPPDATKLRVPPLPTTPPIAAVPAAQSNTTPADVPGVKKRVSAREPGLKLFAGFLIALCIIGFAIIIYSYLQLRVLVGGHLQVNNLLLLAFAAGTIPLCVSLYLLLAKSVLIVRILLILIGVSFALACISSGARLFAAPQLTDVVGVFLCLGMAYWTWKVFKDVSLLED